MHCLRCGTEVDAPEVFCEACRAHMKDDPVSRETPVMIQPRPEFTPMRKRPPKPEELLAQSERALDKTRRLCVTMFFLCLCLCVLLAIAVKFGSRGPAIGQNYTTVVDSMVPSGSVTEVKP